MSPEEERDMATLGTLMAFMVAMHEGTGRVPLALAMPPVIFDALVRELSRRAIIHDVGQSEGDPSEIRWQTPGGIVRITRVEEHNFSVVLT